MRFGALAVAMTLSTFALASGARAAGREPAASASAADREAARAFAEKGYEIFEAGDIPRAMEFFLEAEKRFHAPPHLLYIARCQAKLGNLVEALATYQKLADETFDAQAPKPFRDAHDVGVKELAALDARVPKVTVVVAEPRPNGVAVRIDGRPIALASLVAPIALNPGAHVIEMSSSDAAIATERRTIDLAEGARTTVELAARATNAPVSARPPSIVPPAIAFGVGAIGLGVGVFAGAASLAHVSRLGDICANKRCAPGDQHLADSARTLGNVSTAGFVIGGLGVAAGGVLIALRLRARHAARATVEPVVGLGAIGVRGRF